MRLLVSYGWYINNSGDDSLNWQMLLPYEECRWLWWVANESRVDFLKVCLLFLLGSRQRSSWLGFDLNSRLECHVTRATRKYETRTTCRSVRWVNEYARNGISSQKNASLNSRIKDCIYIPFPTSDCLKMKLANQRYAALSADISYHPANDPIHGAQHMIARAIYPHALHRQMGQNLCSPVSFVPCGTYHSG